MKDASAGKPVTPAWLERAAVHYLERYASSAENLRRVLARKLRRRLAAGEPVTPDMDGWIADTVARSVRSGLVDDSSYAAARVASLQRRGSSTRTVRAKLSEKGVAPDTVTAALTESDADELALARRFAERRRLGPYRRIPDPTRRNRDLAALARAGFPYGIAVKALAASDQEA